MVIKNHALPLAKQCLVDSQILCIEAQCSNTSLVRVEFALMLCAAFAGQLGLLRRMGMTTINLDTAADLMQHLSGRNTVSQESCYGKSNYLRTFNLTGYVLAALIPRALRSISETFELLPSLGHVTSNKTHPRVVSLNQIFDLPLWSRGV